MPPETDEFIRIIYKLAHDRNIEPMLETGDDDFSMAIPGLSRFRVNTYRQRGSLAAVIRIIAFNLPDPQDLHIPPAVMEAADLTKGMVLIKFLTEKALYTMDGFDKTAWQPPGDQMDRLTNACSYRTLETGDDDFSWNTWSARFQTKYMTSVQICRIICSASGILGNGSDHRSRRKRKIHHHGISSIR